MSNRITCPRHVRFSPVSDQIAAQRQATLGTEVTSVRRKRVTPQLNSLQMHNDRAFRHSRCGDARVAGILTDPLSGHPNALVGAGFVLIDGYR
jgi:hypothetical protein